MQQNEGVMHQRSVVIKSLRMLGKVRLSSIMLVEIKKNKEKETGEHE